MARKGLNIYKRKDGRWEARYIKSRNTQGKPRYGYLYATSYHEVRNNLQRVIQAMNTYDAEKVPATNCKFMGFSAIWLENSSTSLKESTYIRYRTLLNCYLMPSFQQLEISEITNHTCKVVTKKSRPKRTALIIHVIPRGRRVAAWGTAAARSYRTARCGRNGGAWCIRPFPARLLAYRFWPARSAGRRRLPAAFRPWG